jgi:ATP-binding cassette subfamily B protein
LAGLLLLGLLTGPLGLLAPVPLKIVVDSVIGGHSLPAFLSRNVPAFLVQTPGVLLGGAALLVVVIAVLNQAQGVSTSVLRTYTAERLTLDLRARVFRHVQRLSVSYHDSRGSTDSVYRIQSDTWAVQYICVDALLSLAGSIFTLVAMLYVTARMDWRLTLVAAAVSPALFLLSSRYRPRLRQRSREVKKLESTAWALVQEVLAAARLVKAYAREEHERERYVRQSREGVKARLRLTLAEGTYGLLVGLTTAVGTAAVLWVGALHVRQGILTLGDLLLVIAYLGQLYEPLKTIGRKAASMQQYMASAERVFALLDEAPDVVERPGARPLTRARGDVAFRNVTFSYLDNRPVLREVSFDAPAGARVGVAGRTGAGKTTLLSLLTRFYDPQGGQILLDGVDLRDYKLADLRNQFALVLQEPVLFSTTIAENIAYARPEATEQEIVQAAKLANAHDFITHLPDGYRTRVGERGMRLSGGERQRIALARAFLKDAPILLLDEPTSSVDVKTEAAILDAMERLMQGRTTFIIAHRLNTLESCDLRLELEHGRLTQQGWAPMPAGKTDD